MTTEPAMSDLCKWSNITTKPIFKLTDMFINSSQCCKTSFSLDCLKAWIREHWELGAWLSITIFIFKWSFIVGSSAAHCRKLTVKAFQTKQPSSNHFTTYLDIRMESDVALQSKLQHNGWKSCNLKPGTVNSLIRQQQMPVYFKVFIKAELEQVYTYIMESVWL